MPGAQKVLPLVLLPVRPPSASQVPHLTNGNDNDLQAENAMRIKAMHKHLMSIAVPQNYRKVGKQAEKV